MLRSLLKINRNPTGIVQFGIDPIENRIIHPHEGECVEDYNGIETYVFSKPLLNCSSLRLNDKGKLIKFKIMDSDNYILYKRINNMDIPEYLVVIGKDNICDLYKIDSDGKILEKDYTDYIEKMFLDKISDEFQEYKIPNILDTNEYKILMNIIQMTKINFKNVVFYDAIFDFNIGNKYFEHKFNTKFNIYVKINILGHCFYALKHSRNIDPDKIFENKLQLYIGNRNLYYTLTEEKINKIINKFKKKFKINIHSKDINKYIISYHCNHSFQNIDCYKNVYKKILGKLNRELLYKINEKVIDEKIKEFVDNHEDIKVTLEDSLAVGNCEYGTRQFGKKYGFDEDNLPTVKELYDIMKEDWNYSENIRLILIYMMNKIEDDSED